MQNPPDAAWNQLAWTRAVGAVSPDAGVMCIALYLAMRADHRTGEVPAWVTRAIIAADTGRCERTCAKAIKWLAQLGFCDRRGPGGGTLRLLMTPAALTEAVRIAGSESRATAARDSRASDTHVHGVHACNDYTSTRATAARGAVHAVHDKSQISQESQEAGSAQASAPAHVHARDEHPIPTATPAADQVPAPSAPDEREATARAVRSYYCRLVEELRGATTTENAVPLSHVETVIDAVRELEPGAADSWDNTRRATNGLLKFYVEGYPQWPHMWALARRDTLTTQISMWQKPRGTEAQRRRPGDIPQNAITATWGYAQKAACG